MRVRANKNPSSESALIVGPSPWMSKRVMNYPLSENTLVMYVIMEYGLIKIFSH